MSFDLTSFSHSVVHWTNAHSGLGSWVGAVGAILAIFVTWSLSRAEYLRTTRQMIARRNSEIALIRGIIHEFDLLLQKYSQAALGDRREAKAFYPKHLNDAEFHAARDLANLPVTQWPSFASYCAFKQYWHFSLEAFDTSRVQPIDKDDLGNKLKEHDTWLNELHECLSRAHGRPYI
jgi:hypothetical protein